MSNETWWYARVMASPNPETDERVNVGLLIGNGRPDTIEFFEGLPRLEGLTTTREREMFRDMLHAVGAELRRGSDLPTIKQVAGAQLRFSSPIALYHKPTQEVLDVLRSRFLASPEEEGDDDDGEPQAERLVHAVQETVSRLIHPTGIQVFRRPKAGHLYPSLAKRLAGVPRVDVALRARSTDLILGAVDLHEGRHPNATLQNPGVRLGKAFFRYNEVRNEVGEQEGRNLRIVGVLFRPSGRAEREAHEYLAHIWERDADEVRTLDREDDLGPFMREEVERIGGEFPPDASLESRDFPMNTE